MAKSGREAPRFVEKSEKNSDFVKKKGNFSEKRGKNMAQVVASRQLWAIFFPLFSGDHFPPPPGGGGANWKIYTPV